VNHKRRGWAPLHLQARSSAREEVREEGALKHGADLGAQQGGLREAKARLKRKVDSFRNVLASALFAFAVAMAAPTQPVGLSGQPISPAANVFTLRPAEAILSNPNAGMARSATAALRRAVPVVNDKVGGIQTDLEKAQYLLRFPNRKPWSQMATIASQSLSKLELDKSAVMAGVPKENVEDANQAVKKISDALDKMQISLAAQDSDRTATYLSRALQGTSELEMLQCPKLPYTIPPIYSKLPRLQGRATLRMHVANTGSPIDVILDGYSAPLTAGNFVENVKEGIYEGSKIAVTDKTTVFVRPSKAVDKAQTPLEVRLKDEFLPDYRQGLDVTNGDYPALPLSIYGAVAMVHGSDDTLNAPAEFFIYKFDRASMGGLGGLSFEEGQFSVFGYVTEDSRDALEALRDGSGIEKIEILKGEERLVIPA